MNAQTSNNSSMPSLIDLINAQVKTAEAQHAEQLKIVEAAKLARKAKDDAITYNSIRKSAANKMVSDIQAQLAKDLKNIDDEAQKTYKAEMIRLGLDSDKYPLQSALDFVDTKAVTPVLESVGAATAKVFELGNGIKNRFLKGFSK